MHTMNDQTTIPAAAVIPNSRFIFTVYGDDYRELSVNTNSKIQELLPGDGQIEIERFDIKDNSLGYGPRRWRAEVVVKI